VCIKSSYLAKNIRMETVRFQEDTEVKIKVALIVRVKLSVLRDVKKCSDKQERNSL